MSSSTSFITTSYSTRIKESVALLNHYSDQLWTSDHDVVLDEFLNNPLKHTRLIAFVETGSQHEDHLLRLQFNVPTHLGLDELAFFLQEDATPKKIQVGMVRGNTLDSLLHVMQDLYTPLLSDNSRWPETVRKDFDLELQVSRTFALLAVITVR